MRAGDGKELLDLGPGGLLNLLWALHLAALVCKVCDAGRPGIPHTSIKVHAPRHRLHLLSRLAFGGRIFPFSFGPWITLNLMIHLAHHNVKEIRICASSFWLCLWDLEHPVASLGADLTLFRVWLSRHTDGSAVVVVPYTYTLHRFGVVDIVLVMLAAAGLGLAHGTRLLTADA